MGIKDWALVILGGAVLLGIVGYLNASEAAKEADRRAEDAREARDSVARIADARRDSLAQVREEETQVRDSLRSVLDSLAREAPEREEEVEVATEALDESLVELAERVRPELEGLVQQATTQLEEEREARNAQLLLARSQTGVWRGRAESFETELIETRETLSAVEAELALERELTAELTTARDEWRSAARSSVFGLKVPSGLVAGVTATLGVAAGAAVF